MLKFCRHGAVALAIMLVPLLSFSAVTVTVNGSNHTIPQTNERGWGANVTAWIQAISANTLQPSGGSFTLTAEADFGANFGLKALSFKSRALNPAGAGVLRMGNDEALGWRNAGNSANLLLKVNSSNVLEFDGKALVNVDDLLDYATDADLAAITANIGLIENDITNLDSRLGTVENDLNGHLSALSNAHDASEIAFTPVVTVASTDVQSAIAEVASDAASALSAHEVDTTGVHGIADTTSLLTTSNAKVVTNKDIDGGTASNTNRITAPKNTKSNLSGLTRKEATVVYATDEKKLYVDDGSTLVAVGSGSGGNSHGVLTNGGFEESVATTGWTVNTAGGVSCVADLSDFVDDGGKQSLVCTLTNVNGNIISQTITPKGVYNFEDSIFIKTTVPNIEMCARIGASDVQCVDANNSGEWLKHVATSVTVNGFLATIVVRTKSSTSGTVRFDTSYKGLNRNIGTIASSSVVFTATGIPTGSYPGATIWPNKTGDVLNEYNTATGVFTPKRDGKYCWNSSVHIGGTGGADKFILTYPQVGSTQYFQLGAMVRPINGVTSTNLESNNCIDLVAGASFMMVTNTDLGSPTFINNNWSYLTIRRYPTSAEQVVNLGQTRDGMGDVFYTSKTQCPAGSEDADGAAISRSTPLGQSLVAGGLIYGIGDGSTTVNKPDLRGIFVRATGSQTIAGITYGPIPQGAQGTDQMQGHFHNPIAGPGAQFHVFQSSGGTTAGSGTGTALIGRNTTGAAVTDGTNGTPRVGSETRPAFLALKSCIQNVFTKAPLVKHAVVTSSEGVERIERVAVDLSCNISPCTISRQSGSWVSSITRVGTGQYSVNLVAGIFSASPTCVCGGGYNGANNQWCEVSSPTTSSITLNTLRANGTVSDSPLSLICTGPR